MLEKNVQAIQARLKPQDKVLDIGGWASPFHRANFVMDMAPYETRLRVSKNRNPHHMMGMPEQFRADTWIQRDICDREPYPFADKELDFVVCSHTLEDIRDPLWVCSEMGRIAKAGYIESPSRLIESCRGVNQDCPVGYYHHRWLVEVEGDTVFFRQKSGMIFQHWSYSFPRKFYRSLQPEQRMTWLFWEGTLEAKEISFYDKEEIKQGLTEFVVRHHPYPAWRFQTESAWKKVRRGRRAVMDTLRGRRKK